MCPHGSSALLFLAMLMCTKWRERVRSLIVGRTKGQKYCGEVVPQVRALTRAGRTQRQTAALVLERVSVSSSSGRTPQGEKFERKCVFSGFKSLRIGLAEEGAWINSAEKTLSRPQRH